MSIDLDALIAKTAPKRQTAPKKQAAAQGKSRLDLDALIARTAKPVRQAAPRAPARPKRQEITEDMLVAALDTLRGQLSAGTGYRTNYVDPLFVRFWLDWDGERVVIAEGPYTKHDVLITPRIRAALERYAARETEIRLRAARQQKLPIPGQEERLPETGPLGVEAQARRRGTGPIQTEGGGARAEYDKHGAVIEIGGKQYVFRGGVAIGPKQPYPQEMQEVVPASEWKGPTLTSAQMYRVWDLGLGRRGASYRGVKILVKGEPWVMTGKVLPVRPRPLSWDIFDREVYRDTKTGRYWYVVGHKAGGRGTKGSPDPACVWAVDAEAPDPAKAKPECVDVEHFKREFYATHLSGGPAYDAQAQREFKALPQAVRRFGVKGKLDAHQVYMAAAARIPAAQRTNRYA